MAMFVLVYIFSSLGPLFLSLCGFASMFSTNLMIYGVRTLILHQFLDRVFCFSVRDPPQCYAIHS